MKREGYGLVQVVSGYLIWGLLPVFWKLLEHVGSFEVILHRIVWGAVGAAIFFLMRGKSPVRILMTVWRSQNWFLLILSALTVTVNWLSYVYAIATDHILQASLGYYISPILLVLLGVLLFKEKMNTLQKAALILALLGVIYSALQVGTVPWLSLLIAGTFALYATIKKRMGISGMNALLSDTVFLSPFAIAAMVFLYSRGTGSFLTQGASTDMLPLMAGPATLLPLGLFIQGTIKSSYKTVGFLQFITPTMTFLLGTVVYGERFSLHEGVTFLFIIAGVLCYIISLMHHRTHTRAKR
jgi:chloramphenicol-sensitive protein RarD